MDNIILEAQLMLIPKHEKYKTLMMYKDKASSLIEKEVTKLERANKIDDNLKLYIIINLKNHRVEIFSSKPTYDYGLEICITIRNSDIKKIANDINNAHSIAKDVINVIFKNLLE